MRSFIRGRAWLGWTFIIFCFTGLPIAAILMKLGVSPDAAIAIGLVLAVFLTPYLAIRLGGGR